MDAKFANGLMGHRVEVKVSAKSPLQILTIIDKVNTWEIDQNPDGCKFAVQSDVYVAMDEAGVVDRIAPHTIMRVILPVNEPSITSGQWKELLQREHPLTVPSEPCDWNNFNWNNMGDVMLLQGILQNHGYTVSIPINDEMVASKGDDCVFIDINGACLTAYGSRVYRDLPSIPLNEWVKNPTIEALMPKP